MIHPLVWMFPEHAELSPNAKREPAIWNIRKQNNNLKCERSKHETMSFFLTKNPKTSV